VTIRASDRAASETFYATVLQTLGIELTHSGELGPEWGDFALAAASAEKPVTRRLHIGFAAPSRAHVDEFWQAGTAAGYPDDGAPGLRPEYSDDYYGAFLLDPDGNSAEAVHHGSLRNGAIVDHLWIRVTDLEASTRFYETVAPAALPRRSRARRPDALRLLRRLVLDRQRR
jgi:catechol 2,3-dioxygenase-like lactoylglutathione lyase family enzyme